MKVRLESVERVERVEGTDLGSLWSSSWVESMLQRKFAAFHLKLPVRVFNVSGNLKVVRYLRSQLKGDEVYWEAWVSGFGSAAAFS